MAPPSPWIREVTPLAFLWLAIQVPRFATPAYVGASDLMADFDLTAAGAGLLMSIYFPVYAAAQVPAGVLADRYPSGTILRLGGVADAVFTASAYQAAFLLPGVALAGALGVAALLTLATRARTGLGSHP